MKRLGRKWSLLLALLLLVPLPVRALDVRNIFSDMSDTLYAHMNEWMSIAAVQEAKDLDMTLTIDRTSLQAGESAQAQVALINPRLHACAVTLQMTVSQAKYVEITGDKAQETLSLPAARIEADGSITPGRVERTYALTMQEMHGEGWLEAVAAASMQEGSRWYQQTQKLTLSAPQISAVLRATSQTAAPQERFFYELALVNSGGAPGMAQLDVMLPQGVSFTPQAQTESVTPVTPGEAEPVAQTMAAQENAPGPEIQGNTLRYALSMPAAQYDDRGELIEPAYYTLRVPVTVDAQALEDTPTAVRVLSCGATLDGQKLQEERVTVRGPIIECTLTPALRDMESGAMLHYTCEVKNSGYTPADVRVTFQMPEGLRFTRFVTRGLQNKVSGDTLSWVIHLDAAEFNLAGEAEPAKASFTWQAEAQELEEGVNALLVPATAVYQIGETGKAVATDVALTTIHRPTVMGLSSADWFLVGWASIVLILTVAVLLVLIRRDEEKGN